ncbi:MAG: response regulator [Candidatus Aminicenantes bacterium]|nr:MAG: response regulator [Candidatus Aminicenantes bacterium]
MEYIEALFLKFNIFAIAPLIVGFLMLVLGTVTIIRDRASKVSSSFFLVTLSIFMWLGSLPWLYSASNEHVALFWAKIEHFGVAFIPSFFFIFTLDIVQRYKKYKYFGWATLVLSGGFCAGFVFSPHFLKGVTSMPWGYYPQYGTYGFLLIVYLALFMMISLDLIWLEYMKSASDRERSRLMGIFLGVAVGLLGAIDFVGVFGVQVYPLGYIPVFICTLILGQTIMRFRLIDLTPSFAANHILKTMEGLVAVVNLSGRISFVNRSLCELLGYKEEELNEQPITLLFEINDKNFFPNVNKSWVLRDEEMEWRGRDGTKVELSVSASLIRDKKSDPAGIVYAATDITERKKHERELIKAKEAAEQANKAKSEFLANMSHEIRTPLNAVIGFSDILTDTSLSNIQKDYVDTVKESGKLLLALISDILDFSKIESGEIQLEAIDFNLKNLVEDVLRIARPKVSNTKVELYYDYDERVPTNFVGDPTRIRQIILNLLNNAIKFTEKGDIGVSVLPSTGKKTDKRSNNELFGVQISVQDTGIGIPPEKQKLIFETFTQADSSTTRKYGGTGLGLAITKALVEKMDGAIWVESEAGEGSEFTFTLNLRESDPSAIAEISPLNTEELIGKNVFIVDDNENARRLLRTFCKKAGLNIIAEAHTAVQGLKDLEKMQTIPDLILSDIMMPGMDGYEFARKVRSNNFKGLKLIAVSSDARPGSAKEAKDAGFDAFVTKPITERGVINVMKTVLGDKRADGQIVTTHMAEELIGKRARVLVAEDNPVNKKLIAILLQKLGFESEIVSNGEEAVEKAMSEDFDICLMDIHMPVMSGIEATEQIRKKGNTTLPIVALTADVFKEGKERCLEAGMNDFLSRPVKPNKLEQKIAEWTD